MIANSGTFRAWCGAANAAAALEFVHVVAGSPSSSGPICLIDVPEDMVRSRHIQGSRAYDTVDAALLVYFRDDVTQATEIDAAYDFLNRLGGVIAEVEQQSNPWTGLSIQRVSFASAPHRVDPEDDEDGDPSQRYSGPAYYECALLFSYQWMQP